jgi:hypothetical protein
VYKDSDQHVGNVFVRAIVDLVRALQLVRARKSFEERADIIAKFTIADAGLLQNVSGEDVKIKLGRDVEMSRIGENGFNQSRMVENRVARFRIAQKIDQGNAVVPRAGEGADDKIKISGGKPCPTICPNHRAFRSRALTMPQPSLFEATFISVGAVSQELLVGATMSKLRADLQSDAVAS